MEVKTENNNTDNKKMDSNENSTKEVNNCGDKSIDNNNDNDNQKRNNNTKNQRERSTSNRRNRSRSPTQGNNASRDPRSSRRVYVANVPFDVKWNELKDLFRDKVGNVVFCQMFENDEGKSRGCGLVEFSDQQTAKRAIDIMHRSEFKGRELVVKEDLDCERDRQGRIISNSSNSNMNSNNSNSNRDHSRDSRRDGGGSTRGNRNPVQQAPPPDHFGYGYDHSVMSGGAYGPIPHFNTFGLSQQFLDSLGISGPLNNRVFVANLEYKVDSNKLDEIFKMAGRIARVKLTTDSQGQSKGYGTVEYEHPVEAVQAISMFHNQKLYGRPMSVRMDKYECEEEVDTLPTKLPVGLDNIGKGLGVGGQPLNIAKSIMNAALLPPPHHPHPHHLGHPHFGPPHQAHVHFAGGNTTMMQPVQSVQQIQVPLPTGGQQNAATSTQQMQQHAQMQTQQMQQPQMMSVGVAAGTEQSISTYPALQAQQTGTMQQMAPQVASQAPQAPAVSVYHHQQAINTMQQQQIALNQAGGVVGVPNVATTNNNLSVYSTFERQFRDASKYATTQQPQQQQQQQPTSAVWRS